MAIEDIIKNFTEGDLEIVYKEVKYLDKKIKIQRFTELFSDPLENLGFDSEAIKLGTESFEHEEIAGNAIRDCLTAIVKRTYAIEIYKPSL